VPRAFGIHFVQVAKARHCYRLRVGLASSVKAASLVFTLARCAALFPGARTGDRAKMLGISNDSQSLRGPLPARHLKRRL